MKKQNLIVVRTRLSIFVWGLFSLIACQTEKSRLELVLEISGSNRHELEKVLDLYYQSPEDSLKLKAAVFLIENMPGHTSISGNRLQEHQKQIAASLENEADSEEIETIIRSFHFSDDLIKNDIEIITAEILINTIEQTFKVWKENPWSRHLTFEEVCEYLLPYKYAEGQVLDDWREKLSDKFDTALSSNFVNDENYHSVCQAGYFINREINEKSGVMLSSARIPYGSTFFVRSYWINSLSGIVKNTLRSSWLL
ncbi:MAG: hypothetical protein LUE93_08820 [Bacteroides sp.]|nr:hypothetical protein [Bacteroides sp.]